MSDLLECSDEPYVSYRFLDKNLIRCRFFIHYGFLRVRGLVVSDRFVLVGGGSINMLTCSEAVIVTRGRPVYIGNVYCGKLYLVGVRYPIIIDQGKVVELYCRNTLFNQLSVRKLFISGRSGFRKLVDCREIVFNDPHTWFEEMRCSPSKVVFNYKLFIES